MKTIKVVVILFIVAGLFSCNNENVCYDKNMDNNVVAIEAVKSDLHNLNASYMPKQGSQTRMPKWLRLLIFGAADVAGGIWGGVSGACGASTLAWNVTKHEVKSVEETIVNDGQDVPTFKDNNLNGIEVGSAGYIHNVVILSAFGQNEDIYAMNNEDVMAVVFQTLEKETGTTLSDTQKAEIMDCTNKIVNSFDANKSVAEYFSELKLQTTDQKKKEALEICEIVLDGLQYVNDDDTTYVKAATDIIKTSDITPELKATLLDGVSVANASAKLWNTDEITTVPSKVY